MALDPTFSIRMDLSDLVKAGLTVEAMADAWKSPEMQQAVTQGLQDIVKLAQIERFTGKGPFPIPERRLGLVSQRLRGSLYSQPAQMTSTGYRGAMGSPLEYFAIHEFGFKGEVSVREHFRKAATITKPGPWRDTPKGRLLSVRKKSLLLKDSKVKAHKRKLDVEARQPLRAALADHSQRIIDGAVRGVFKAVLNKQKGLS